MSGVHGHEVGVCAAEKVAHLQPFKVRLGCRIRLNRALQRSELACVDAQPWVWWESSTCIASDIRRVWLPAVDGGGNRCEDYRSGDKIHDGKNHGDNPGGDRQSGFPIPARTSSLCERNTIASTARARNALEVLGVLEI